MIAHRRFTIALPGPVLLLFGVAAVITSLLLLHVLMGKHGPVTAQSIGTVAAAHGAAAPATGQITGAVHGAAGSQGDAAGSQSATAASLPGTDASWAYGPAGCLGICGENSVLMVSMCALVLMLLSIFGLRLPATGGPLFSGLLRAPPAIPAAAQALPFTPSLIQLSVSRR